MSDYKQGYPPMPRAFPPHPEPPRPAIARVEIGHCADCRWWKTENTAYGLSESEGECQKNGSGLPATKARTQSYYDAYLITKADFGCVQFGAK